MTEVDGRSGNISSVITIDYSVSVTAQGQVTNTHRVRKLSWIGLALTKVTYTDTQVHIIHSAIQD